MRDLLLTLPLAGLLGLACAHQPPAPPPKAVEAEKPAAAPAPEASAPQLYAQGRERMAHKDWAGARAELDRFLAKEPQSAAGHFDAGWVAEQAGDAQAARAHYQAALELEPAHLGAALNLTRLCQFDKRPADAVALLQKALSKREGDPLLLGALAGVQLSQKKYDEAAETVRLVLLRHPDDAGAYKTLGLIEAERGRLQLAELAFNSARKLDGKDPGVVNNLGLLAARRDDVASARARFQEATQLGPGYAPAWANLGAIALQYRDYRTAADAYGKAAQLDPQRTELHLAYAWALEGLKKPKEAREQYDAVLAARPADQDALYGRAAALKAEGNLPEAMKAFQAYAAAPGAAKAKDAQSQMAQIELRLKSAQPVAKVEVKRDAKGSADLSALPIGKDEEAAANSPALPDVSDEPADIPATQVEEKSAAPAKTGASPEEKAPPAAKDEKAPGQLPEKGEGGTSNVVEKARAAR